jgi:hypothetical protein
VWGGAGAPVLGAGVVSVVGEVLVGRPAAPAGAARVAVVLVGGALGGAIVLALQGRLVGLGVVGSAGGRVGWCGGQWVKEEGSGGLLWAGIGWAWGEGGVCVGGGSLQWLGDVAGGLVCHL